MRILRSLLGCASAAMVLMSAGCAMVPKSQLSACQCYNRELQQRNCDLLAQYENLRRYNQELADKNLDGENRLAEQEELIARFQEQVDGYQQDRDQLASSYASMLDQGRSSPLPRDVRRKLEDFGLRHPNFVEVDADAGISKFKSDVLFASGRSELTEEGKRGLHEFASIFQDPSGRALKIMVVGHTDERPIVRDTTRALHETNWHLSAHRAIAVEQYLEQGGIEPRRIGVVGYGPYQPVASGKTAGALAKNRRVEIFVLAPDAPVVGRSDRATR